MSVETSTALLGRVEWACASCARGARPFSRRYRQFLLAPGTLFTFGSLIRVFRSHPVQHHKAVAARTSQRVRRATAPNSSPLAGSVQR